MDEGATKTRAQLGSRRKALWAPTPWPEEPQQAEHPPDEGETETPWKEAGKGKERNRK